MNKYSIKLEVSVEVEAFNQEDAQEYLNDIFITDDEIKAIKLVSIKEKKQVLTTTSFNMYNCTVGRGKA